MRVAKAVRADSGDHLFAKHGAAIKTMGNQARDSGHDIDQCVLIVAIPGARLFDSLASMAPQEGDIEVVEKGIDEHNPGKTTLVAELVTKEFFERHYTEAVEAFSVMYDKHCVNSLVVVIDMGEGRYTMSRLDFFPVSAKGGSA